jgi:hypothetical protein
MNTLEGHLDLDTLTPQLRRVIKIAAVEAERGDQGNRIGIDHILVSALMCDDNYAAALIKACNLTVADLRNGEFKPKLIVPSA